MGFFSMFATATGNLLDIKTLDIGSDMLIATVCQFEPLNVRKEFKKEISEHIKHLYINNIEEPYTNSEVAVIKLIIYCELSKSYPNILKELQIGIRKIMQMEGDKMPNRTSIKIYSVLDYE